MGHILKGYGGKVTINGVEFSVKNLEMTVVQKVFQKHVDFVWKSLASGLCVPSGYFTPPGGSANWTNTAAASSVPPETLDEAIKRMLRIKREWAWRDRVNGELVRLARGGFACDRRQAERLLVISEWQTRSLMAIAEHHRMRIR